MCIDGVRHGMISAQLCFVLRASVRSRAQISKWTTLLTFQYNTFCISTCLFIISLSTLIAPSAYPYATATKSVRLAGWLALLQLALTLIQSLCSVHVWSIYPSLYRFTIRMGAFAMCFRFAHYRPIACGRCRTTFHRDRQMWVCFVCRRFNYISFINWLNYNSAECSCVWEWVNIVSNWFNFLVYCIEWKYQPNYDLNT